MFLHFVNDYLDVRYQPASICEEVLLARAEILKSIIASKLETTNYFFP